MSLLLRTGLCARPHLLRRSVVIRGISSQRSGDVSNQKRRTVPRSLKAQAKALPTQEVSSSGHRLARLTSTQRQKALKLFNTAPRDAAINSDPDAEFFGVTVNGHRFDSAADGTYVCALGGLPVFHSSQKVEMGLGCPTFQAVLDAEHIEEDVVMLGMPPRRGAGDEMCRVVDHHNDDSQTSDKDWSGMMHIQIRDRRAGSLLGYTLTVDGKKVYCVSDISLCFVEETIEGLIPTEAWHAQIGIPGAPGHPATPLEASNVLPTSAEGEVFGASRKAVAAPHSDSTAEGATFSLAHQASFWGPWVVGCYMMSVGVGAATCGTLSYIEPSLSLL